MKKHLSSAEVIKRQSQIVSRRKAWIKQFHAIYAGLIGIGVVMIQPFLYATTQQDTAATICVFAFAVAIPLLAALMLLNYEEEFRTQLSLSPIIEVVKTIAQLAALVGLVAGFWHINALAGAITIVAVILGCVAYSVGYAQLMRFRQKAPNDQIDV